MILGIVTKGSSTDQYGKYIEKGDIVGILGCTREIDEIYSSTTFYVLLPTGDIATLTWSGGALRDHLEYVQMRISFLDQDDSRLTRF